MSRVIAIGDIHGCKDRLVAILKEIDPQPEDTFVFLGDFVDRGPDSKGVIEEVMALAEKCTVHKILGNHEEMILGAYYTGAASDQKFWCKFGGIECLASYGVDNVKKIPLEHLNFFANCKDYIEIDDFIFVHAGCNPRTNISENSGAILRWSKLDDDPIPHISGETIVCGHTACTKIVDFEHTICIDTGCGIWAGGKLTAFDVKSGTFWQVGGRTKKVKKFMR